MDQLPWLVMHAMMLYILATLLTSIATWFTGHLAVQWRQKLVSTLHQRYCSNAAHEHIQNKSSCSSSSNNNNNKEAIVPVDNPDQRMTQDAASLCEQLAIVSRILSAVPFKVPFYAFMTVSYVGWQGLAAITVFFFLGALVQQLVMSRIAGLVYVQEAKEGNFRAAHARVREYSPEIAAATAATTTTVIRGGGREKDAVVVSAEYAFLQASLEAVLTNQNKLVWGRTVLAASSKSIDYIGTILNYLVVAAAVVVMHKESKQQQQQQQQEGGGALAEFVSNASFFTLMLINSLTEVLDAADQLAAVIGLAARVGQLFAVLSPSATNIDNGVCHMQHENHHHHTSHHNNDGLRRVSVDGRSPSALEMEEHASLVDTLLPPVTLILDTNNECSVGSAEISVHRLKPALQQEVQAIFPDAPSPPDTSLTAIITFQFAPPPSSSSSSPSSILNGGGGGGLLSNQMMDTMLTRLINWEGSFSQALSSLPSQQQLKTECSGSDNNNNQHKQRWWCDAANPRTGHPLNGSQGWTKWSEVTAAHTILGYSKNEQGLCPLIIHPQHGYNAYPATIFTNAPYSVVLKALATVFGKDALPPPSPLLKIQHLTISSPSDTSRFIVKDLDVEITAGQHIIISGPNGCGKTTLIRSILGLYPICQGSIISFSSSSSSPSSCMCLPQRPLAAPGHSLWQQIVYPSAQRPINDQVIVHLLQMVGLGYLLERTLDHPFLDNNGGGPSTSDAENSSTTGTNSSNSSSWGSILSPGELQRLGFARVLYHRPCLVFLDESTSAIGGNVGRELYGLLYEAGITCVSVRQMEEEERCDDNNSRVLVLNSSGDGRWEMKGREVE
jgi:ABC-type uncharacterized transport system fused permease/ATPase subunit